MYRQVLAHNWILLTMPVKNFWCPLLLLTQQGCPCIVLCTFPVTHRKVGCLSTFPANYDNNLTQSSGMTGAKDHCRV